VTDPNTPQGPVWSPPPAGEPRPTDALPATPVPGAVPPGIPVSPTAAPAARVATNGDAPGHSRAGLLTSVLLAGALVVATAGVAFAVGRVTAPASTTGRGNFSGNGTANGQFPGANGANGGAGFGGAFRGALGNGTVALSGTVTAIDGQTLTLQLASGQTVTIDLSGTTTYHTATTGSAGDVTSGSSVVVQVQTARGGGGSGFQPGASAQPGSSANSAGGLTFSASDVTVVSK